MTLGRVFAFYVGVPVTLAALFTLQRSGPSLYLGMAEGFAFWLLGTLCLWVANDLATRAFAATLRPMGAPLWLVLLLGSLGGIVLNLPTQEWRFRLFLDDQALGSLGLSFPAPTWEYARLVLRGWAVGALIWTAANYGFLRLAGVTRYGYASLVPEVPAAANSGALAWSQGMASGVNGPMQVLGVPAGDLIALQAQEHYIKVWTKAGSRLVHGRFRDALDNVRGLPGCQVHRSWWVSATAIETLTREGSSYRLRLANGTMVPVGRTYLLELKRLGVASSGDG